MTAVLFTTSTPTGTRAVLFVDGERRDLDDPATHPAPFVLSPVVRELIRMAGVDLVEDVDRRVLVREEDTGPVWRDRLAEVEGRRAELAQAEKLRADAAKAIEDAKAIEERA